MRFVAVLTVGALAVLSAVLPCEAISCHNGDELCGYKHGSSHSEGTVCCKKSEGRRCLADPKGGIRTTCQKPTTCKAGRVPCGHVPTKYGFSADTKCCAAGEKCYYDPKNMAGPTICKKPIQCEAGRERCGYIRDKTPGTMCCPKGMHCILDPTSETRTTHCSSVLICYGSEQYCGGKFTSAGAKGNFTYCCREGEVCKLDAARTDGQSVCGKAVTCPAGQALCGGNPDSSLSHNKCCAKGESCLGLDPTVGAPMQCVKLPPCPSPRVLCGQIPNKTHPDVCCQAGSVCLHDSSRTDGKTVCAKPKQCGKGEEPCGRRGYLYQAHADPGPYDSREAMWSADTTCCKPPARCHSNWVQGDSNTLETKCLAPITCATGIEPCGAADSQFVSNPDNECCPSDETCTRAGNCCVDVSICEPKRAKFL